MQPIDETLLLVRRQIVKAGFAAQGVFLLLRGQVLVIVEPLGKMLLPGTGRLGIWMSRRVWLRLRRRARRRWLLRMRW